MRGRRELARSGCSERIGIRPDCDHGRRDGLRGGSAARAGEPVFNRTFAHYTPAEFAAIRAWGADSIGAQVAQPAVDPLDPEFDATFLAEVVSAIWAAGAAGLNVIVSVQAEPQSAQQVNLVAQLPNLATLRV